MAIKTSARTNKPRPTSLGRGVTFGEERFGATRCTRPGNSPSSPPHKRYPITTPLTNRWSWRTLTPGQSVHHNFDPAWIVTILRRENGAIEFLDDVSWHKLQHHAEKLVTRSSSALLSSSTAGFTRTLPALLQHGNLMSASGHEGDFQFRTTKGWRRVAKATTRKREHIETWVHKESSENLSPSAKQQNGEQQQSNTHTWSNSDLCVDKATGHVTFRTPASFRKISESSESGANLLLSCGDHGSALLADACRLQTTRSMTTKARKNRKAREKKLQEKYNIGKRNKVPYIPKHAFEEKPLTRSRARLYHVHAKEFYALP